MHNEDLIFGLELSQSREFIVPVPYFDISESPDSARALYEQKASWYLGALQSYEYPGQILQRKKYFVLEKSRLYILTTKLFFYSLYWIAGPTFLLALLVLSITTLNPWFVTLSLIGLILFLMMPGFMAYESIKKMGVFPDQALTGQQVCRALIVGSFIAYMLHGASAYRGFASYVRRFLGGYDIVKKKTAMRHRKDS
jgi:hypothetical protein